MCFTQLTWNRVAALPEMKKIMENHRNVICFKWLIIWPHKARSGRRQWHQHCQPDVVLLFAVPALLDKEQSMVSDNEWPQHALRKRRRWWQKVTNRYGTGQPVVPASARSSEVTRRTHVRLVIYKAISMSWIRSTAAVGHAWCWLVSGWTAAEEMELCWSIADERWTSGDKYWWGRLNGVACRPPSD